MQYRGRDTYYLELLLAVLSIRLAFLCFSRWFSGSSVVLPIPSGLILPMWVWGISWALSALGLLYGFTFHRLRVIEYSALFTSVLWLQAVYWTSHMNSVLTLRLGWAIIISLFSVVVYFYHTRLARSLMGHANGRFLS